MIELNLLLVPEKECKAMIEHGYVEWNPQRKPMICSSLDEETCRD